ncbi:MAG: hypothetical protein M1828_005866 [Chrysothrix sp. TS-e1954]|nr:MAG: hypothetical protein M1828_005866 [Chrysothrix sp. TS-e1954]
MSLPKTVVVLIAVHVWLATTASADSSDPLFELGLHRRQIPGTHSNGPGYYSGTVADNCEGVIASAAGVMVFIPADPSNCICTKDGASGTSSDGGVTCTVDSTSEGQVTVGDGNQTVAQGGGTQLGTTSSNTTALEPGQLADNNASITSLNFTNVPENLTTENNTLTSSSALNLLNNSNPTTAGIAAALNDTALSILNFSLTSSNSIDVVGSPVDLTNWQANYLPNAAVGSFPCPLFNKTKPSNETEPDQPDDETTNDTQPVDTEAGVEAAVPATEAAVDAALTGLTAAALTGSAAAALAAGFSDNTIDTLANTSYCDGSTPQNPTYDFTAPPSNAWQPFNATNNSIPLANTTDLVWVGRWGPNLPRGKWTACLDEVQSHVDAGETAAQFFTGDFARSCFFTQTANGDTARADAALPGVVAIWQWFRCQGGSNAITGQIVPASGGGVAVATFGLTGVGT